MPTPLEIVIRSAKEQYGTVPLDNNDRIAVEAYLKAPDDADAHLLGILGGIQMSEFIQVNVQNEWNATENAFWKKIESKENAGDLDKPDGWGPSITLDLIANALP